MSPKEEQNNEEITSETEQSGTESDSQSSAGSGSGSETPKKGYVTEESYKGLQRVAEKQKVKLENELAQLRQRLESQATELEEIKLAAAEKEKLEKVQAELNTSLANLQAERDRLTHQLNQQKIVLAEFPELAPLASYIPVADTDEAFKTNAQAFQAALKQYMKSAIQSNISGATPPINSGNGSGESMETDKLWNEVYRLAGIPGKEHEYEEAFARLQEVLKTQQ